MPAARKAPESVETFLEALEHPSRKEIIFLREIILGADKNISEGIKWNAPSFHVASEYFATLHLRAKKGVPVILYLGVKKRQLPDGGIAVNDPESMLEWLADDRAMVTFNDLDDITARRHAFENLLREWIRHV